MEINGFKTFKVETPDSGDPALPPPQDPQADQNLDDALDSLFDDGDGNYGSTSIAPSALDEYVFTTAAGTSSEANAIVGGLSQLPPTLEQILAANENAINNLDMVIEKYDAFEQKLQELIGQYREAFAIYPTADVQQKINAAGASLIKTGQERDKAQAKFTLVKEQEQTELISGKDINGNGILGPKELGIGVYYNDADGKTYYFDLKTGEAVTRPIIDPDYPSKITDNDSLEIIPKTDATPVPDPNEPPVDLYLQLNELKTDYHSETNEFGVPINFIMPECLWVLKKDGKLEPEFNEETGDGLGHLIPAPFVYSETEGIHQEISDADKGKYMQIQVAKIKVSSCDSGFAFVAPAGAGGGVIKGQNTFIELSDKDGNVIFSTRIEGYTYDPAIDPSAPIPPAGMLQSDGTYRVDASNVGFGVNYDMCAGPKETDCSMYVSNCRHIVGHELGDMAEILNMDPTPEMKDSKAYQENFGFFEGSSFSSWRYDGTDGHPYNTEIPHSDTYGGAGAYGIPPYGDYHDRFCFTPPDIGASLVPPEIMSYDPLTCQQTGVFMWHASGKITGSGQRDAVVIRGPNDHTGYWQDKDLPEIELGKPGYASTYHGRGGGDIVRGYTGNFAGEGISGAWFEAGGNDKVIIEPMAGSGPGNPNGENSTETKDEICDPKNFVYVDGAAETWLRNNAEDNVHIRSENQTQTGAIFNNDAYYLHGQIFAYNTEDPDIHTDSGQPLEASTSHWEEDVDFEQFETGDAGVDKAIGNYYSDDDFEIPEGIQTEIEGTYGAAVKAELDGFFDAAYGELDTEMQEIYSMLNDG